MLRGDLSVPLLVLGDLHVLGFDPDAIDELIEASEEANRP
jgi:hypothetical protein